MTFTPKTWVTGSIVDAAALIDIETRLAAYSDIIGNNTVSVYNIKVYGALANARQVVDAAITTGTNVLTSSTAVFTSADVGKAITVQQAISATASLVTTIASFTNSTTVVLSATATRTVNGVYATIGTLANTAINNACTAAGASGIVYVPSGTYMTSSTVYFSYANQTIILAKGATLLADGSQVRPFQVNADGVTICGEGAFDGNWAGMADPTNPAPAILMTNGGPKHWLSLLDITIKNGPLYGVQLTNCNHIVVRGCRIENIGAQSLNLTSSISGITDYLIENNRIDNTMVNGTLPVSGVAIGSNGSGIAVGGALTTQISHVRIIGNTVKCPSALTTTLNANSQGVIGGLLNSVIANNTVEGSRLAYSPALSEGLSFTGNTARGALDYGFEFPGLTFLACTGNVCDGLGLTTVGIVFNAGLTGLVSYNTISGNTIRGVMGNGISTQNAQVHHLTISGNTVDVSSPINGVGIFLKNSSRCIVIGNICNNSGTATDGILSQGCSNSTIMGNQCYGFTNSVRLDELSAQTRALLIVIGNITDNATTVVKVANLTLGTGCRIHSNGADTALTGV